MKTICILLCLVLPTTPIMAEPVFKPAAGYAIGAVVVCAGGYCLYRIAKFCQRKLPTKKPGETNSFWFSMEGDEYAAAYEYSSIGSCPPPPDVNVITHDGGSTATTFIINVLLNNGQPTISMNAVRDSQTWDEFASEMASHGLFLTGHASYDPQFSRNRVPCAGAEVPVSFEPFTGRVIHQADEPLVQVKIERSPNLKDWYPLLVTDTAENSSFGVMDTTVDGQGFYRVSVYRP